MPDTRLDLGYVRKGCPNDCHLRFLIRISTGSSQCYSIFYYDLAFGPYQLETSMADCIETKTQ